MYPRLGQEGWSSARSFLRTCCDWPPLIHVLTIIAAGIALLDYSTHFPVDVQDKLGATLTSLLLLVALMIHASAKGQENERNLTHERSRLASIVENATDAILSTSLDGRIDTWNAAATAMFGYARDEARGANVCDLLTSEAQQVLSALSQGREMTASGITLKATCTRKDGSTFPAVISFFPVRDCENVLAMGATVRDQTAEQSFEECILQLTHKLKGEVEERTVQLSQSMALQDEVRHMAMHDPLTGLANRTVFRERLMRAVERHQADACHPFAILALDLDRFKTVNDSYGHPVGDMLLAQLGARLQQCLAEDELVARLGGDEFAVLLASGADRAKAVATAQKLTAACCLPFDIEDLKLEVGLSTGIALHDATARALDADEIFKLADNALYEAKNAGRGSYHLFECAELAKGTNSSRIALDMREAVRRQDFHLLYQPIVNATSGKVESLEALVRWKHPVRGSISPADFISIAEDSGLIVPLGDWILRTACAEAMTWPDDVTVAVNVSPIQIRQEGWDDGVFAALEATGLPADRLVIEVTEGVLMQNAEAVIARLQRVQDHGVGIALDDFGTGYSSLSYLRKFRFDKLKIDQAFIRDIEDVNCMAIIRAMVKIGRQLSMIIVAEGVENQKVQALVQREGCMQVQGYHFSKPLDPEAARAYIGRPSSVPSLSTEDLRSGAYDRTAAA